MNTVLAVLFVSWVLTFLTRGDLVSLDLLRSALIENGVEPDVLRILGVLIGFGVVGISAWDVIDGWRKSMRAEPGGSLKPRP